MRGYIYIYKSAIGIQVAFTLLNAPNFHEQISSRSVRSWGGTALVTGLNYYPIECTAHLPSVSCSVSHST